MMSATILRRPTVSMPVLGISLLLVVLSVGCGKKIPTPPTEKMSKKTADGKRRTPAGRPNGKPESEPAAVAVVPIRTGDIFTTYATTATLEAESLADIPARVPGVLKAPLVEEGESVTEGQLLIEIEDEEYRHRLTQAEVEFKQQRTGFERSKKMRSLGLVSVEETDTAQSRMKAAEAAWQLAKLELSYTSVRAPFSGRIITRHVDAGQTVSAGDALFTIADFSRLLARVHVPAREFRNIRRDQPVDLTVDSTGEKLKGSILLISPVVDSTTGTIKVTIAIDHFTARTRPGDFVRVSIVTDRHTNTLLVPRTAVLDDHGVQVIFTTENGIAHRREVRTGYSDDTETEILSGLSGDELVVIQGQRSLKDGQPVTILETVDAPDSATGS